MIALLAWIAWTSFLSSAIAAPTHSPISIYIDPLDQLQFEDIRALDRQGQFVSQEEFGRSGLGFTKSAVWLRFSRDHDGLESHWFLGSIRPDFTTMDVYLIDPAGRLIDQAQQGTASPNRALKTRLPAGRLHLPDRGLYTFYVKVKSPLQLSLSLYLVTEGEYFRLASQEANILYAYFGTVIGLMLYNLCLFFVLRSRDYIFYILFGLGMLLNAYVQSGFAEVNDFSLPGLGSTADAVRVLFLPSITSLLFTISFLQIRKRSPWLARAMLAIAGFGALCQLMLWFDRDSFVRNFSSGCDLLAVISVFIGSAIAIRAGDRVAKVFLLAWGLLALSVGVWILGNIGVLEKNLYVAMSPIVGNMSEMVLMSMALAMRIRDIKQERLLAELKAEEKENLQNLLRMVCHDISNPLSIIKSIAHVSRRSGEAEHPHMPRVRKAAESIETILGQVRKYEGYRSGKLQVAITPCSLSKVFEEIRFTFAARAQEKDVQLDCALPSALQNLRVVADETALSHEVMNNLVSNSLKFTRPGGHVRVSVKSLPRFVLIEVLDDGIGIPQEMLPLLFDPNEPTTRRGTLAEPGSGFGLPLVKTFVEIFGGEISIESNESADERPSTNKSRDHHDHGTRITIKLNRAPDLSLG